MNSKGADQTARMQIIARKTPETGFLALSPILSAYYICCIYSDALKPTIIVEANTMKL